MRAMTLNEYLKAERGRTIFVAERAGLSAAFVSQLAKAVRPVPADRAADIERATGGAVRRWHLRPHDWHRIWPELKGAQGAPDVPAPADAF